MELQNPMFRTPVRCFSSTFLRAQTRFELSKVKLYRDDLRENKNYFELAEGSSYRGFELSRVRVTEGKITVNVCRKSRGSS